MCLDVDIGLEVVLFLSTFIVSGCRGGGGQQVDGVV